MVNLRYYYMHAINMHMSIYSGFIQVLVDYIYYFVTIACDYYFSQLCVFLLFIVFLCVMCGVFLAFWIYG